MNRDDFTITRLPTPVNTDGMGIKELREQYKLLEGYAISQAQQLSDAHSRISTLIWTLADYNITFAAMCDSYESGDPAAILHMVKRLSEKRAGHNEKQKAKVH